MPTYGVALEAAIQQAGQFFYNAQLGVMTVPMDGLRGSPAAQRLQAAMHWLRKQPEAQGLPVSYFGVDVGVAVALQAVSGVNDVASVLSWNGRPDLAWNSLGAVRTPVLLMVDEQQNWLRYWANQVVNACLGPVSQLEKVTGPADMANLALEWMSQDRRRLFDSTPCLPLIRGLATGVIALALCASLTPTTLASAQPELTSAATQAASPVEEMDPFSNGLVLKAGNIAGDENASVTGVKNDSPSPRVSGSAKKGKKGSKKQPPAQEYKLGGGSVAGDGIQPLGTGSIQLIDGGHVKWFANTNITFATSSSASGAVSEASFTAPVDATTLNGGVAASVLNDAFDGYNALMINGTTWPVEVNVGNIIYNQNGPASMDCLNRQVVFNPQVVGNLTVQRKFYVPENDEFARWANIYTNHGTTPITIETGTGNNLGSDASTIITGTSSGDATADTGDLWVTTMQDYSGVTSSDPRLGHVMQGRLPRVGVNVIHFANGDDNPYWGYNLTIQPGETAVILNFATAQPSKADAAAKAAWLSEAPIPTMNCLTDQELAAVVNFNMPTDASLSVSAHTQSVEPGGALTYTLDATNAGPSQADGVVVTGTLPLGSTYLGGTGTGWTINESGGVVTATHDPLSPGETATFNINIKAPLIYGVITFSANLSTYNQDTDPTNNTATANTTVQSLIYLPLIEKK